MTDPQETAREGRDVRRYRKKPVEVEARLFSCPAVGPGIAAWCGGRYVVEPKPSDPLDVAYWIDIPTLEGTMRAHSNDWIIRGVKGEFYPCKPDIFDATYEALPERGET